MGTQPYETFLWGLIKRYDYHFMMQISTGQWAEKHGRSGDGILHKTGENPNNISWDLGTFKNYYDSKIIYFAIGEN